MSATDILADIKAAPKMSEWKSNEEIAEYALQDVLRRAEWEARKSEEDQEWINAHAFAADSHRQRVRFALRHGRDPWKHTRYASQPYSTALCEIDTAIFLRMLQYRKRSYEMDSTLLRDLATHAPANVKALLRLTINQDYGLPVDPADVETLASDPIVIVPTVEQWDGKGDATPFINGHDMHRMWLRRDGDGITIRTMRETVTVADEAAAEQWIRSNIAKVEPALNVSEGTGT